MRILICASEAPLPPLNGMRVPLREVCGRLAERHAVTVVALRRAGQFGTGPEGVELIELPLAEPERAAAWAARARALVTNRPVDAARLVAPFARALPPLLSARRFDVAHVTLGCLAGIAPLLRGIPAAIAPLDAWHLNVRAEADAARGPERLWRRAQERAVRRHEARAYRPFAAAILVTSEDAAEVAWLDGGLRTVVIPNGVDAAHFAAPGDGARRGIVFTGVLEVPANERAAVRLARRLLPRVRARVPGAELTIVGRAPGPAVRALAALAGVEVVPDVPDLRPWLWGARVYACPMASGTGIKNKLLEAMAAGAPAVATRLACQGLAVRDGEQLCIADSDDELAAALAALLEDPVRAARLARSALAYVRAQHDWDAVARAHEALYSELAGQA